MEIKTIPFRAFGRNTYFFLKDYSVLLIEKMKTNSRYVQNRDLLKGFQVGHRISGKAGYSVQKMIKD